MFVVKLVEPWSQSAVLAGDVAVGVTSPVGFSGNASPDMVLPAVAEVALGH